MVSVKSQKKINSKKTLDDLLSSKEVITGKEVIHNLKELEKQKKQFEESVGDELRYERHVTINTKVFNNLGECYE